jgi:hypothetical protein
MDNYLLKEGFLDSRQVSPMSRADLLLFWEAVCKSRRHIAGCVLTPCTRPAQLIGLVSNGGRHQRLTSSVQYDGVNSRMRMA